jgi:hypothetical protein
MGVNHGGGAGERIPLNLQWGDALIHAISYFDVHTSPLLVQKKFV